ncbi:MAG: hypothetical protein ACYTDU_06885 [Planctomycetota bacterium]|jgi:hypothetical protein
MSYPKMLGLLLLLCPVACSSYRQKYDAEASVTYNEGAEKSLKVEVVWLKPRGEFIHVLLRFTNKYAEPVSVDGESVSLAFGDEPATLHTAVKRQTMQSGETGQTLFIFKLKTKMDAKGTAVATVRPRSAGGKLLPAATLKLPVKPWVGA